MVELLSTKIPGRIAFYKAVLEDAGIQTFIRNEHLSGVEGMIPIFQPALCVVNDADEDRARQLIKDAKLSEDSGDGLEILCPECSEKNPSNFATCWNCGKILNS